MTTALHNDASSLREQYIEYGFLGELCREMWKRGKQMDILRSHTDRNGYDILLEVDGVERHVQLKASFVGATTARQKVNVKLAEKPSGCVIWVRFDQSTLELVDFLWFGSAAGQPIKDLGDKVARHSKGNKDGHKAERKALRILNKGQFEKVSGIECLADRLFG